MDIHKPKPFHNLREFLSEIAIVVIGVSIALGAEQAIEWWHWHHKVEAVEDAMRAELVADDMPQAYARIAIERCLADQLDALQAMAKPGADGAAFRARAVDYATPIRTWDNDAHQQAQQSDLSAHMTASRLAAWAAAYAGIPGIRVFADQEGAARHRMLYRRYANRKLTTADADQLSDAIDDLRGANRATVGGGKAMLYNAQTQLGLQIPATEQANILADARRAHGQCVVKPDWDIAPVMNEQVITKQQRAHLQHF